MKAVIFDKQMRLEPCAISGGPWHFTCEAEVNPSQDDDGVFHDIESCDLVLLHINNYNAQEFILRVVLPKLQSPDGFALILFTGGGDEEDVRNKDLLDQLAKLYLTNWCFIKHINGPADINIGGFVSDWTATQKPPNFSKLIPRALPHASIAAYLLRKLNCLDEYPEVKELAGKESPLGDYDVTIDAYFGFEDTRILRAAEFGVLPLALSLRAKISHSWLDHEVLSVKEDDVASRWGNGAWSKIAERWKTLHMLALEFGAALPVLWASSALVDHLNVFKVMPPERIEAIKQQLDELQEHGIACQSQTEYLKRLESFWQAAQTFFEVTENRDNEEAEIKAAWAKVLDPANALKSLFRDGTIPDGIVLP